MSCSATVGAIPPVGTVADSHDDALAETVNGRYRIELIRRPACAEPRRHV